MKKKQRILLITLIILAISYIGMITVSADCTPKPSLKIFVENAPDELYYLDLLVEDKSKNTDTTARHDNLKEVRQDISIGIRNSFGNIIKQL